jgi:hypothetical protein
MAHRHGPTRSTQSDQQTPTLAPCASLLNPAYLYNDRQEEIMMKNTPRPTTKHPSLLWPEYYESIIDLTKANNGSKQVTKALIKQDRDTLEHIVDHHLVSQADILRELNALPEEEKKVKHTSGFPQGAYLFLLRLCHFTLATHASLCLVALGQVDAWKKVNALVAEEEGAIPIAIVIECVWGLLFRCHMDRTFYNGMQKALKHNTISSRMVQTIHRGSTRLFHFPTPPQPFPNQ